jgi:hypothetical protein
LWQWRSLGSWGRGHTTRDPSFAPPSISHTNMQVPHGELASAQSALMSFLIWMEHRPPKRVMAPVRIGDPSQVHDEDYVVYLPWPSVAHPCLSTSYGVSHVRRPLGHGLTSLLGTIRTHGGASRYVL